jgi:hypothetical protein
MQKIHLLPSSQVCDTLAEKLVLVENNEYFSFEENEMGELVLGCLFGLCMYYVMHLRFLVFCI